MNINKEIYNVNFEKVYKINIFDIHISSKNNFLFDVMRKTLNLKLIKFFIKNFEDEELISSWGQMNKIFLLSLMYEKEEVIKFLTKYLEYIISIDFGFLYNNKIIIEKFLEKEKFNIKIDFSKINKKIKLRLKTKRIIY